MRHLENKMDSFLMYYFILPRNIHHTRYYKNKKLKMLHLRTTLCSEQYI